MKKVKLVLKKKTILKKILFNFGIGKSKSLAHNNELGFNQRVFSKIYTKAQYVKFLALRQKYKVNRSLMTIAKNNFKLQRNIKLYRATRTKLGLPSRGQRTKTNSKTKKKLRRIKGNFFDFSNFFKYDKK